jgi:type II secretory pathway predicted ATPase ExeA
MLSDIRSYYGLTREISLTGQSTYFETSQSQHVVKELRLAIKDGKLIVLAGIVGTGKTTTLRKIQDLLEQDKEKEILVAKSLSVDGGQISLGTLILALFCDLTTEKDGPMPTQTERRERALRALIRKRKKPVALFIDDAHQLHPKTLVGLKRLMEIVRDGKGTLSVVLAGHPKLKRICCVRRWKRSARAPRCLNWTASVPTRKNTYTGCWPRLPHLGPRSRPC